mmetsp:Transcript_25713/g.55083  ORF Transcript_25713/g.55083 Transcript_25713/m.55083 type:complete len:548 (-) Transcript_25713:244-1887(-)
MRRTDGHGDGGGDDDSESGRKLNAPAPVEVDVGDVGADGPDDAVPEGVNPEEDEEPSNGHDPDGGLGLAALGGALLEGLDDGGHGAGGVSGVVGPVGEGLERRDEDQERLEEVQGVLLLLVVDLALVDRVGVVDGAHDLLGLGVGWGGRVGGLGEDVWGLGAVGSGVLLRRGGDGGHVDLLLPRLDVLGLLGGQPGPDVPPAVGGASHEERHAGRDGEDGELVHRELLLGGRGLHKNQEKHHVGLGAVQDWHTDVGIPEWASAKLWVDDGVIGAKVRGRADESREERRGDPGEDDAAEASLEGPVEAAPLGGGPGGSDASADDGVGGGDRHGGCAGQQQEDAGGRQGGEHGDGVERHRTVAVAAGEALCVANLGGSLDGLGDTVADGHSPGPLHDSPDEAPPAERDGAGPDRRPPRVGRVVRADAVGHHAGDHGADAHDPLEGAWVDEVVVVGRARGVGGLVLLEVLEEVDVVAVVDAGLALHHHDLLALHLDGRGGGGVSGGRGGGRLGGLILRDGDLQDGRAERHAKQEGRDGPLHRRVGRHCSP